MAAPRSLSSATLSLGDDRSDLDAFGGGSWATSRVALIANSLESEKSFRVGATDFVLISERSIRLGR